jgi:hypothetical protein
VDQFLFRTLNTAPATTAISQAPPESLPAPEAPAPVK